MFIFTQKSMNYYISFIIISVTLFISGCSTNKNQSVQNNKVLLTYWDSKLDNLIEQKNSELMNKAFSDYLCLFDNASEDTIKMSIEKFMKEAEKDSIFYIQTVMMAERSLFDRNAPQMNEEHYIYFLQSVQQSNCLSKAYKFRYEKQLESCLKNRPGTKAASFSFITSEGKECNLNDYSAKHLLIIFYSSRCKDCHIIMDQLKASTDIHQWISSKELNIMAICTDGMKDTWDKEKDYFPSTWTNGFDEKGEIIMKGTYMLRMMPSIYLLDANKKVLLKDTNPEDVIKYMNEHKTQP